MQGRGGRGGIGSTDGTTSLRNPAETDKNTQKQNNPFYFCIPTMPIFFSMFKTLEGKTVLLELKNSLQLKGKLVSVDQYLNLKLDEVEVVDRENYPQLVRSFSCVSTQELPIRPSVGRWWHNGILRKLVLCLQLGPLPTPFKEPLLIHRHLPPHDHATHFLFLSPPSLFSPSQFSLTPPL